MSTTARPRHAAQSAAKNQGAGTSTAPEQSTAGAKKPAKRQSKLVSVLLQLVAMLGIGLLVYADAADWFSRFGQRDDISSYVEKAEQVPDEERQRILEAADDYNDQLSPGPLADPYISQGEDEALGTELYQAYEELLRISGTDVIGTVSYPELDIALPIRHGTGEDAISRGVGHMYGTSMPVGGPSTRSVLTAHSGLANTQLFTPLLDAEVGDTFWISVLGEDHYYRVAETETVLPEEVSSLEVIDGEDWVTLFTCEPIGVNSHRFMVHAERIPDPEDGGDEAITSDSLSAGFPWWALWFLGGSAVVAWLLFSKPKQKTGRKTKRSKRT